MPRKQFEPFFYSYLLSSIYLFCLCCLAIRKIIKIASHDTNGNARKINAGFVSRIVTKPLYAIRETIARPSIDQYKSCRVVTVQMEVTLFAIKSPTNGERTQTVKSPIRIIDF